MLYALLIEYEGTDFHGSQFQKGVRTVQGELQKVLDKIFGRFINLSFASRTDSGVHATGQVATFQSEKEIDSEDLMRAINFHGPDDITILSATLASQNFDPRRDALQREYVYKFSDAPIRSSLHRNFEVHIKKHLDLETMGAAANALIGRHDFLSFAGPLARRDKTTIRTINEARFYRDCDRVKFLISGDGFVHQQVRRITGELIKVGVGKILREEFESLILRPVRGSAQSVLSPKGLYLSRIKYSPSYPFSSFYEYN